MDAGVPEGDVALRNDLLTDRAPGGGVAVTAAAPATLHVELLSQPLLTKLASDK